MLFIDGNLLRVMWHRWAQYSQFVNSYRYSLAVTFTRWQRILILGTSNNILVTVTRLECVRLQVTSSFFTPVTVISAVTYVFKKVT
jgi:hypothetical protein